MPDTPFSVQLSYMTRTEPLTEETLAYLVRTEAEHAAHIDALTAAVRPYIEGRPDSHIVPMTVGQLRAILGEPHDA